MGHNGLCLVGPRADRYRFGQVGANGGDCFMGRVVAFLLLLALPLTLSACGGGADASAADETKIREAIAALSQTEGTPGVFVKGRDIVVNYAQRPDGYAVFVREAALNANKAIGGKQIKLYVVDSPTVATAIPTSNQFWCSVTANDGRMAGNTC